MTNKIKNMKVEIEEILEEVMDDAYREGVASVSQVADRILNLLGEPVAWEVTFYREYAGNRTLNGIMTYTPDDLYMDGKITEMSRNPLYSLNHEESTNE